MRRRPLQVCLTITLGPWAILAADAKCETRLQTADTIVVWDARPAGPLLRRLYAAGQAPWANRTAEALPDHVDVDGQRLPLTWTLLSSASQTDTHRAAFVYETSAPHLRLTWEWQARAGYG